MSSGHHTHSGGHSHGSGIRLAPEVSAILTRGLGELLDLTEGLSFKPTVQWPRESAGAGCQPKSKLSAIGDLTERSRQAKMLSTCYTVRAVGGVCSAPPEVSGWQLGMFVRQLGPIRDCWDLLLGR